jgi:hypothetical protein
MLFDKGLNSGHINRPSAGPSPAEALAFPLLLTPAFCAIRMDMQPHCCEFSDMTGHSRARDAKSIGQLECRDVSHVIAIAQAGQIGSGQFPRRTPNAAVALPLRAGGCVHGLIGQPRHRGNLPCHGLRTTVFHIGC